MAAENSQHTECSIKGMSVVFSAPDQRSKMTKAEMSELQTLMEAFGADKGVRFSAQEQ